MWIVNIKATLMEYLSSIASGLVGKPINDFQPDKQVFHGDLNLIEFSTCHYKLRGTFDQHYWASIPYVFEQECRLGSAILRYAISKYTLDLPLYLWHIGAAEATLTRTISDLGLGIVASLANSGSSANKESFLKFGHPKYAYLHIGSYQDISIDTVKEFYCDFSTGFDIVIEDTTFQMESPDRLSQIKSVIEKMKDDGILILTEKFVGDEYDYWEAIKDTEFKARYFSAESIENKQLNVLSKMENNQVSILEISEITSVLFSAGLCFWNSGNFYSVAVSNKKENLIRFISMLTSPCIPDHFTRSREIIPLFGLVEGELTYSTNNY
jgi:hypothetical protein